MIGKGRRSEAVKEAIIQYRAVYFGAAGGAGALLARAVQGCEVVAYHDLGTEAIAKLVVEDFPLYVINDIVGNDLYDMGTERYRVG
jgi:fumarate hydratase subunit beta